MLWRAAAAAVIIGMWAFKILKRAVGAANGLVHHADCWANFYADQSRFPRDIHHGVRGRGLARHFYPAAMRFCCFGAASIAASRVLLACHF